MIKLQPPLKKEDIAALRAGAAAISTTAPAVWEL